METILLNLHYHKSHAFRVAALLSQRWGSFSAKQMVEQVYDEQAFAAEHSDETSSHANQCLVMNQRNLSRYRG